MGIKISFDIGGVLTKYPDIFRPLFQALSENDEDGFEVFILTDMQDREHTLKLLNQNAFHISPERVINCDFSVDGELCKAKKMKELGIHIHIDDFPGYLTHEGAPVRLMVMPNPYLPYYDDSWDDDRQPDFGRRRAAKR